MGVESKGGDNAEPGRTGKIVVACEEAKLPRYCFRAESRSFVSEIVRKIFALLFGRFRTGEFLEARIIPERIEHRIEPEQRGSKRDAHTK